MSEPDRRLTTRIRSVFGFTSMPFAKGLDPEHLFATDAYRNALDRLRYLGDRRGIGAVFGAPGTGKSTLIRSFLGSLGKATHAIAYVPFSSCSVVELFRQIAFAFQIEPRFRKADLARDLSERILKLSRTQKLTALLVIDDAHLMTASVLDDLRLLTSFDGDSSDDLTLLLAGQPQLESQLRLATNEALAQRIVLKVRLRSLHPEEVSAYLTHRLEIAGRTARLFLPEAVEAIAKGSRGIPRLVDRLAEHSLLLALRDKKKEIDAEIVTEAIDEVEP
jgi:type II secretory pathway predicted ATPase ExeA